jgi:putative ABC transport system substrate-binding protein
LRLPTADQYQRAASYIDRILKGEKPADPPVQAPTKVNLTTAKALALPCHPPCSLVADGVIDPRVLKLALARA